MGWYSDLQGTLDDVGLGDVSDFLDNPLVSGGIEMALGNEISKYLQPEVPQVGYQGKIPEYTAVRDRVPMPVPVEGQAPRRPGESGRRYFSDTVFAARPDTAIPTVAGSASYSPVSGTEPSTGTNAYDGGRWYSLRAQGLLPRR